MGARSWVNRNRLPQDPPSDEKMWEMDGQKFMVASSENVTRVAQTSGICRVLNKPYS
uniref:Uncharacterized protein n=1 Tax=Cucumis melo TaxID=3656 RepID=A0A9I9D8U2_CUCME